MPRLEDDREGAFATARVPGRFYVSRRFPQGGSDTDVVDPRMCRFAYQVIDENGEVRFESDNGWEIVVRETPTRQQLKALFFEDDRSVQSMAFQRFNAAGEQLNRESFVLSGSEIGALASFLGLIRSQALDLAESDEGVRLLPAGVDALLADDVARQAVFQRYRDAFVDLLQADVESPEIVAFARRRQELQIFETLINDSDTFASRRAELKSLGRRSGPEDVWQNFFESNEWIFGTGLAPQFLHAWDSQPPRADRGGCFGIRQGEASRCVDAYGRSPQRVGVRRDQDTRDAAAAWCGVSPRSLARERRGCWRRGAVPSNHR